MSPQPNHLAHFAINADDVERAKRFYAAVFGWRFEAWGPPGFYMIKTKEGGDLARMARSRSVTTPRSRARVASSAPSPWPAWIKRRGG